VPEARKNLAEDPARGQRDKLTRGSGVNALASIAAVNADPPAVAAVTRWLSLGPRSTQHPILRQAWRTAFAPLGIEAAWLEAEPFSGLETATAECWLREPRWNPATLDPNVPGGGALQAWASRASEVRVSAAGHLVFPAAAGDTWPAVRLSVAAALSAALFIHAAAALLLADEDAARLFAEGRDAAFIAYVETRLAAKETSGAGTDSPGTLPATSP
jgi:hypothetical protein